MYLPSVWLLVAFAALGQTSEFSIFNTGNIIQDVVTVTSMADLVLPKGYPLEEYEVETEDGYLLTVFRIPHGRNVSYQNQNDRRPPVLVQHGLLAASTCWVLSDPSKGLGYILADAGYDVWFGNSRGNSYSQKHKYLDPEKDKEKFWDFSFHEMGYYDLPAVVDFILGKTGYSKLHYVGHSQGTSQFFAFLSTRPEYNPKIASMAALAPVAFLNHCRGTTRLLASLSGPIQWMATHLGIYNVMQDSFIMHLFDQTLCKEIAITQSLCDNVLFLIAGYDSQQLNQTLIPIITDVCPAGCSIKQLEHYAQLIYNDNLFQQYDYGKDGNQKRYGQDVPPQYNLTNIAAPIALHYADNDFLGTTEDVAHLYDIIKDTAVIRRVPFDKFNHLDFLWAIDVDELLYNSVLEIINSHVIE